MGEMNKEQIHQSGDHCHMHGNMCGMCCGHRGHWLRWILGLVILVFVFLMGVCLGSLHSSFHRGEFYRTFDGYNGDMMFRNNIEYQIPPGTPVRQGTIMMVPQTTTTTPVK